MGTVNGEEHVWNTQQKKSPITRNEELDPVILFIYQQIFQ